MFLKFPNMGTRFGERSRRLAIGLLQRTGCEGLSTAFQTEQGLRLALRTRSLDHPCQAGV